MILPAGGGCDSHAKPVPVFYCNKQGVSRFFHLSPIVRRAAAFSLWENYPCPFLCSFFLHLPLVFFSLLISSGLGRDRCTFRLVFLAVYATVYPGAMADVVEKGGHHQPFCITTQCFFYFLFLFDICRRGKRRERKTREEKCIDLTLFCINRRFLHPGSVKRIIWRNSRLIFLQGPFQLLTWKPGLFAGIFSRNGCNVYLYEKTV